MAHIFDSDSGDESDFSGFGESDIEVPHEHESDSESDDDDDGPVRADGWSQNFTNLMFDEFVEHPGPNLPDDFNRETAAPMDYFWLMFPIQLVRNLVEHTNSYAFWSQLNRGAVDSNWDDVTEPEMRAFLGINILMGINQLPEADMFWSSDPLFGNTGVQQVMTCNRYHKITQYFHASDRAAEPQRGDPNYDRLYKIREVLDMVSEAFRRGYTFSREVSVDEAMIRYCGRLAFRQYMPAKPIKRGVKVWMLCDANSSYLSKFDVYLGRQDNRTEHGLGYNVVMKMTEQIRNTFRWIFFDNFFTSMPLLQTLLDFGLYACGTVRVNRQGFPKDLKKPRDLVNRGQSKTLQFRDTNLTATVWKDKRLVHHLSTLSSPTDIREAHRRVGRERIHLNQPHTVFAYNKFMGGVDLHDQHRAKYSVGRNSKKWWRYIFWFSLNCAIVNAYIIYKEVSSRVTKKKRFNQLDFRRELIQNLIGGFCKRKRRVGDEVRDPLVQEENIAGHINVRLPGKRTSCKYHKRHLNQRHDTSYGCSICNVHLCKDGCHARYHNLLNQ